MSSNRQAAAGERSDAHELPNTEIPAQRASLGLPVHGYVAQPPEAIILVNQNKIIEEQVLRQIDRHKGRADIDQRMVALAFTKTQEAFMWLNRAVFQPKRIEGEIK